MTLTITIPDNTAAQRMLDDVAAATNWDSGSGITKGDWVRARLIEYLRVVAKRGELKLDQATISTEIDAIVIT